MEVYTAGSKKNGSKKTNLLPPSPIICPVNTFSRKKRKFNQGFNDFPAPPCYYSHVKRKYTSYKVRQRTDFGYESEFPVRYRRTQQRCQKMGRILQETTRTNKGKTPFAVKVVWHSLTINPNRSERRRGRRWEADRNLIDQSELYSGVCPNICKFFRFIYGARYDRRANLH